MKNRLVLGLVAVIATFAAATASYAQALVINAPGVYVLNRNISVTSGDGILITASNVTLDLGGRTVSTSGTGIATGRGVVITSAKSVVVKNGKINSFNFGVFASDSEALTLTDLTILGDNLPGGPVQQGIVFLNTRGSRIEKNTLSSLNVGTLVRGGGTVGNRWIENHIIGGPIRANNVLAMCWNPPMGGNGADTAQVSSGELVYKNHITGFQDGISFTSGSRSNIINENFIQYFARAFRPDTLLPGTGNIVDANVTVLIP